MTTQNQGLPPASTTEGGMHDVSVRVAESRRIFWPGGATDAKVPVRIPLIDAVKVGDSCSNSQSIAALNSSFPEGWPAVAIKIAIVLRGLK